MTRDLFEKQRIVDLYLIQHKEDDQLLNQYYQNTYKRHNMNKFRRLVYHLPYDAVDIRFNYRMMWFTTGVAALGLSFVHPALPLVLTYDFYLLLKALQILNQTTNLIVLDGTKRHVMLNKLNFLGYETAFNAKRIKLKDIKYMGLFENSTITKDNFGMLPSIAKFYSDKAKPDEKGHFRYFYKFMASNEIYLVAKDHPDHEKNCTSEELLMMIMKGQQMKVLDFDYSEEEKAKAEVHRLQTQEIRDIMEFKQLAWNDEEKNLQREYSYFSPNREFSGKFENEKMKKVDDGTFTDNGYR